MRKVRYKKSNRVGQDYWQSYSDMMAALLLMFILIMVSSLLQSYISYEEKIQAQIEQQAIVDAQQLALEEQQELMDLQQQQIDELIGVKMEIIQELRDTFQNSNLTIDIDAQTGAISMDSNILFALNSAVISSDGLEFLDDFLPLYISVLMDDMYFEYVSEIIIEGHTDTNGTYMYNLNLSQQRAYSVASYCLDDSNQLLPDSQLDSLRSIMTANGKSYSNPIYAEDGTVDAAASRRVDIKFRLKDDEMIAQLQEIIVGTDG